MGGRGRGAAGSDRGHNDRGGPGVRRDEGRNREDERWRDDAKGGKGRGQDWDDRGERGRRGGRGRGAAGSDRGHNDRGGPGRPDGEEWGRGGAVADRGPPG